MASCKSNRTTSINQARRSREYSPSKAAIYSPMAVEDDQKQIIISKLKDQIQVLQTNSSDLNALKQHYRNLDQQFNILQNQKKANDSAFAKHHESALKQICSIKNQLDSMKVQFREKKLQIQDLTADQNTLRNQLDQKQIEIERLKNDLRSSIADNEELTCEKQKLTEIHLNVLQEKQRRADDCQKIKAQIHKVETKVTEMSKYQASLQKQQKALTSQIIQFQELNNKADEQIATTSQDINILNDKVNQSQAYVADLQRKIAQTSGIAEKYKNDGLFTKKSIQSQIMKNNDIGKKMQQSETLLTVRINQVKQGHRELDVLNQENTSLQKINSQLQDDVEGCKRHLQNLSLLNSQLVKHMQSISAQDQEVRELINRRERVQRANCLVRQRQQQRRQTRKMEQSSSYSTRYNSKRTFY